MTVTVIEVRPFVDGVEVRSEERENGARLVLTGTAIRYGARSKNLGGFRERIMPGSATEVLQKADVMAFEEHRSDRYLGRLGNGTLRLLDTRESLRYEVELPDTTVGREVAALAQRGDYRGSSFGFRALDETWTEDEDGLVLRTITAFGALRDVGPTVSPAYDDSVAETALRRLADERDLEYRSLLDAARGGRLAAVLLDERTADDEQQQQDDPPVINHRRPTHWFV